MTKERKIFAAKIIRGLYLYPYRSRGENLARGSVWIVSWFLGIVLQWEASKQALGSAYLIFTLSLIMEFLQASNPYRLVRIVLDLFRVLLFIMLVDSVLLTFWDLLPPKIEEFWLCQFLIEGLPYVGAAVCIRICIGTLLALIKAHKYFYDDEELKSQHEFEAEYAEVRKHFQDCLNGYPEGRNT